MLHTLYVDMNSFFASVEQQLDPKLRGRPVAVVPLKADTTAVIAASYEAKAFGVKTGVLVGDARRMCPGLVLVTGNHETYIRVHHQIRDAIDAVIPVHSVCSVDEFACHLAPAERTPDRAADVARRIKRSIAARCGAFLKCSIGIAPNRFLAKVAADMRKPDGQTILQRHELPQCLYALDLIDLPGIGKRMLERLRAAGIFSIERLCALGEAELGRAWGSVVGQYWYYRLRGEVERDETTLRRTIGHSHVLSPERREDAAARAVGVRLLTKVGQRARHLGYVGEELTLSVRYLGPRRPSAGQPHASPKWHGSVKVGGVNDTRTLLAAFAELWEAKPKGRVFKLGLTLSGLTPRGSATGLLFEERRDPDRLSKAMDAINRRYGADVLFPASMHQARKAAPRRIAFSNIPDLDVPDISIEGSDGRPAEEGNPHGRRIV
jgi:DNA polymerase-4